MDNNLKPKGVAYVPQMIAEQKERLRLTIEEFQKADANHKREWAERVEFERGLLSGMERMRDILIID